MPDPEQQTAVDRFLAGVEAGNIPGGLFAHDARLDATVPNWRFSVRGGDTIRDQFAHWYADPGHFTSLDRTPIPQGELIEFTLAWTEKGVPHKCHQAHILRLVDDEIAADTAFCGGRWPGPLLAEMEQAQV